MKHAGGRRGSAPWLSAQSPRLRQKSRDSRHRRTEEHETPRPGAWSLPTLFTLLCNSSHLQNIGSEQRETPREDCFTETHSQVTLALKARNKAYSSGARQSACGCPWLHSEGHQGVLSWHVHGARLEKSICHLISSDLCWKLHCISLLPPNA